jgi:hypothetical protein
MLDAETLTKILFEYKTVSVRYEQYQICQETIFGFAPNSTFLNQTAKQRINNSPTYGRTTAP